MTAAVFDLNEDDEEPLLDWLCHYLYATDPQVKQLVDGGSPMTVFFAVRDRRFCPSSTRLVIRIEDDSTIKVMDEWCAGGTDAEPRATPSWVCGSFGFSTEERAAAGHRAKEEHVALMQVVS